MSKIILDRKNVLEDVLVDFITSLETALECHVLVEESYILDVDDEKAAAILQTVFGGNEHKPISNQLPKPKAKQAETQKPKKTRVDIPYEIMSGSCKGEKVKAGPLAMQIKSGKVEIGTQLHHSVKGDFFVAPTGKLSLLQPGQA